MRAQVFDCEALRRPHDQSPRFESLAVQNLPQKVQREAELRVSRHAGELTHFNLLPLKQLPKLLSSSSFAPLKPSKETKF